MPLLYCHGGPGSGASVSTFAPLTRKDVKLILVSQRGSGLSHPNASLENNTTQALIADMEQVRAHVGVQRWALYGHSWGSTLALAYAIEHPDRVLGLTLSGVYLGNPAERDWWYLERGASCLRPDAFAEFIMPVPEELRGESKAIADFYLERMPDEKESIDLLFSRISNGDYTAEKELRQSLIYRWSAYEYALTRFLPRPTSLHDVIVSGGANQLKAHSLIEAHYFANDCFLEEGHILDNIGLISGRPVHIIQGRYDLVCPAVSAYRLHKALPQSTLNMVESAGHGLINDLESAIFDVLNDPERFPS